MFGRVIVNGGEHVYGVMHRDGIYSIRLPDSTKWMWNWDAQMQLWILTHNKANDDQIGEAQYPANTRQLQLWIELELMDFHKNYRG